MPARYALKGPQIEPEAGHWTFSGYRVRVVDIHNEHPTGTIVPPFDNDPNLLEREIEELVYLANNRPNAGMIGGTFTDSAGAQRSRRPLSMFFSLRPPPITAQFNTERWTVPCDPANPGQPVRPIPNVIEACETATPLIQTGQELARFFEDETPGLMHRHALNCLLFNRSASPPRQARVWMALDIAIYSALLAAWHIKWGHQRGRSPDFTRSYVQRPIEYEKQRGGAPRFEVLFDYELNPDGTERGNRRCPDGFLSPGTPRHPSYPSGHSTFSAAASRILIHFFPDAEEELLNLADNIGLARLWAGVHWRQDHITGQRLGIWVAEQVIRDLCRDPVRPLPPRRSRCDDTIMPPDFRDVDDFKDYRLELARRGECEDNQDVIPPPPGGFSIQEIQGQRGAI